MCWVCIEQIYNRLKIQVQCKYFYWLNANLNEIDVMNYKVKDELLRFLLRKRLSSTFKGDLFFHQKKIFKNFLKLNNNLSKSFCQMRYQNPTHLTE